MSEETIIQMKKYIKKIRDLIDNPTFKFMDKRYVKKTRLDDLVCCMEACFPEKFKKLIKENRLSSINSGKYYKNLLSAPKLKTADCLRLSSRDSLLPYSPRPGKTGGQSPHGSRRIRSRPSRLSRHIPAAACSSRRLFSLV